MSSPYKDKILKEIETLPEDIMPKLYKIIHLFAVESVMGSKKTGKRGSLRGIWKDSQIDESLFIEAKKSLFPFETD